MKARILTVLAVFPVFVLFVILGGIYLRILVFLLSVIGMNEVYTALSKKNRSIHITGYASCLLYYVLPDTPNGSRLYITMTPFVLAVLIYLVISHKRTNIADATVTIFGFCYVAFLLSNICLVRDYPEHGHLLVWLIFICAWASDTGAYFVGITLGKHKLIPHLSPKKTWEGSIGGVVSSGVVAFFYALILNAYFDQPVSFLWFFPVVCVIGAALSQTGDLAASAIKRYAGIKDFGNIFPGHGGVIDRFDSVLFTAPAVYIITITLFRFV